MTSVLAAVIDWPAVAAVGGLMLAILGGLIRLVMVAEALRIEVRRHHKEIERNAHHLDSMMAAQWQTIMRVATMEDYLTDRLSYRPPRMVPQAHPDDGNGP